MFTARSGCVLAASLASAFVASSAHAQFNVISRSGSLNANAFALGFFPGYVCCNTNPLEVASSTGLDSADDLSLGRPLFFGPDGFGRVYEGSYTGQLDQNFTPERIGTRMRMTTYATALSLGSPEANAADASIAGEQTVRFSLAQATTVNVQVRYAGTPGPGGDGRDRIVFRVVELIGETPVFSLLDLALIPGIAGPDRQVGTYSATLNLQAGVNYIVYSAAESRDSDATTPGAPSLEALVIYSLSLPNLCDDIDFNNNGVFPEDQDVIDFFAVLAGSECTGCSDIDFNNNGVFPEDQDIIDFFNVLAGGTCS
ncbi:MAG TPA: hypothetical protein VK157_06145 [Phycisphaerales bacterium]|nr:hypothetical protein [Phycisphaerales bacterium]